MNIPRILGPRSVEKSPVRLAREILAVLLLVILADITIYWGQGYFGYAVFFLGAAAAFLLAKFPPSAARVATAVASAIIVAVALRIMWYGSPLQVVMGLGGLLTLATALQGQTPYVFAVLALLSQVAFAGGAALSVYLISVLQLLRVPRIRASLSVLLPLATCLIFSTVFVLANPDVVNFLGRQMEFLRTFSDWFVRTVLRPTEIVFWIAVAWLGAGLIRPLILFPALRTQDEPRDAVPSQLFPACLNTLVMVNVLFVAYLGYEFFTLWTRRIPEGFYYAGYAHAGAAWLTVALGLATALLSLVFSGPVRHDPRVGKLRQLAWIWSVQNFLLALSVYNRLFIYINFNGMTWMRIVGLFGVSVVVAGFLLVVWKFTYSKNFAWLIQSQLWALALTICLFALLPVDGIAASWNVRRIQQEHLASCMQIGVQPLDLEGVLAIIPLLDSPVEEIREGVAAIVAERASWVIGRSAGAAGYGWTASQLIDDHAVSRFAAVREKWEPFQNFDRGTPAKNRFYDYAYKYY